MTAAAVIVAGGSGERFGAPGGKQLAVVAGRPVLAWSVAAFDACPDIDSVVIVADPERLEEYAEAVGGDKIAAVVGAGETRQRSVTAGLAAVPAGTALVAVHDGARPLVTAETISDAVRYLESDRALDGVVVGHAVYDTLKQVDGGQRVLRTVDRATLWVAQTPQVFRAAVLRKAYESADATWTDATDDAGLVERVGGTVGMVAGPRENIKVTVAEDLAVVEAVLEARRKGLT